MYVEQSSPYEACYNAAVSGLVGTISVRVIDNDGAIVTAASTAGIIEAEAGSGYYCAERTSPTPLGQYSIQWSSDASYAPPNLDAEDLVVVTASTDAVLPPIPAPDEGGLGFGPCTAWTTADDVEACCSVEASSGVIFDAVVDQASQLLYELSGRLYGGLCGPVTVRPPCDCACFGAQRLAYASGGSRLIWAGAYWNWDSHPFGCCGVSRVKLSGYPIREVTEVKIDGDVVTDYRLDESRYVTRLDGARWPACQDMSLPDTEEGTFSLTYTYGQSPPLLGAQAAAQLACELYRECDPASTCALPKGTTRVTRQGITIQRLAFTSWGFRDGRWQTGLPLVDAFLNTYNSAGIMRRPTFWAPGRRYARPVG